MNRDELIALAREAGMYPDNGYAVVLERFAALVAAKEREGCAKVCEPYEDYPGEHAAKIRARKP